MLDEEVPKKNGDIGEVKNTDVMKEEVTEPNSNEVPKRRKRSNI